VEGIAAQNAARPGKTARLEKSDFGERGAAHEGIPGDDFDGGGDRNLAEGRTPAEAADLAELAVRRKKNVGNGLAPAEGAAKDEV
jgi:hypothetical protein